MSHREVKKLEDAVQKLSIIARFLERATAQLDIVRGESEWDGIYVDGEIRYQNHSINECEVLIALAGRPHVVRYGTVRDEWLETHGHYPDKLSDIPDEAWADPLSRED